MWHCVKRFCDPGTIQLAVECVVRHFVRKPFLRRIEVAELRIDFYEIRIDLDVLFVRT